MCYALGKSSVGNLNLVVKSSSTVLLQGNENL